MRKSLFAGVILTILFLSITTKCAMGQSANPAFRPPPTPTPVRPTPTPTPIPPTPTPTPAPTPSPTLLGNATNQRGLGSRVSPAIRAGGAANVIGSRSYTYSVPMFSLPGRHGLNLDLTLYYNSSLWDSGTSAEFGNVVSFISQLSAPSPGFQLDYGYISWATSEFSPPNAILVDSTGAKHVLVEDSTGTQFHTVDSSYITLIPDSTDSTAVATYKNGMQVYYTVAPGSVVTCCPGAVGNSGNTFIMRPVKIEDTSGNFITINYFDSSTTNLSSVVDTVGRTITFVYDANHLLNCITDGGTCNAAGSRTFNFSWNTNYILNYQFTDVVGTGLIPIVPFQGSQFPYTVLTGVTRPDGTRVSFNYGDWFVISDIQEVSNNGTLRYESSYNFPLASAGALSDPPSYTQQTVTTFDKNGNPKQATWLYQSILTNTQVARLVSCLAITDPVGTIHVTKMSAKGDVFDGLPISETVGTGSTSPCTIPPVTIWKSVTTQWITDKNSAGTFTGENPHAQTILTTLSDGVTQSQIQLGYDSHGNTTDIRESDFGSGAPGLFRRETVTTYGTNLGNIVDRPTEIDIKDGTGNLLGHKTFVYDDYTTTPLQSPSLLPTAWDNSGTFASGSSTPRGNLTSSSVYAGVAQTSAITTNYSYDIFGNLVSVNAGCCTHATAQYSIGTEYVLPDNISIGPQGNQLTTSFKYNLAISRIVSMTDPNGQTTLMNYDIDSRPTTAQTPEGIVLTYNYDDTSANTGLNVSNSADALVIKTINDSRGRPLSRQILNGTATVNTTDFINDAVGRTTQVSTPYGPAEAIVYTTTQYDALGRPTNSTPPPVTSASQNPYTATYGTATFSLGSLTTAVGLTRKSVDPTGRTRIEYIDALGNIVRVDEVNPTPSSSSYSTYYVYDPVGNLLLITQGQQTRTYGYDGLRRQTSECLPEMANKCTTFTYTDFNAIKTKTDPRGIVTTYSYDVLNRISSIQYSDGTPSVAFTYGLPGAPNNGGGRLVSSSDGVGSKTYQYDVMGRPTQISQTIGANTFTTAFSYVNGRLKSITYPSGTAGTGTTVTYVYDAIGRLSSVGTGAKTVYSVTSYNAVGQALATAFGNGMAGAYTYNNQHQLATLQYTNATTRLLDLAYSYGGSTDNGQIQSITDNVDSDRSVTFSYDGVGRLQQAQTVNQLSALSWNLQFGYDQYGNRLSETPVGGFASMPNSQLLIDPTTNHVISSGMTYDAAGNMTSDASFDYTFDACNRLTSVGAIGGSLPISTYSYDSVGNRVLKNGTVYIYVGGRVIAEYSIGAGASSPSVEYIYAGPQRVATLSLGTVTYHYWDHLSVRVSADGTGSPVRTYGSYPFGETWYETGVANKWKFTGYENDAESGLNYAGARFHSPALGRFMSLDLFPGTIQNPQSLNRYTHVRNNPVSFTDSTGMFCDTDCDGDGDGEGGGGAAGGGGDDDPCGPFECSTDPGDDPTAPPSGTSGGTVSISFVFDGSTAINDLDLAIDLSDMADIPDASNSTTLLGPTVSTGSQGLDSGSNWDITVDNDFLHDSPQCPGCGTMFRQAATTGNLLAAGTAGVLALVPAAGEGALLLTNIGARTVGWIAGRIGGTGVILGKFLTGEQAQKGINYVEQAAEYGMNAFNLPEKLYSFLDNMGYAWTANQAFLESSIQRGQQFYITSLEMTNNYMSEIEYLASRGIGWDQLKALFTPKF